MSNPYLPPEILDHVVDSLHDDPKTLKRCCLVSKSWIPRTRRHLFARVKLHYREDLECWKRMFPDPSTSPGHFAKSLRIGCASDVTTPDAEAGGWLTGFAHIVHLDLETQERYPGTYTIDDMHPRDHGISLAPFHGFSPALKSLRVDTVKLPPSRIFDFVLSSPLLEDLTVSGRSIWVDDGDGSDDPLTFAQSSNPPVLTGSLVLFLKAGMRPVVNRLLSIPGGIHFRKVVFLWNREEDLLSTITLVGGCSHTLETLHIYRDRDGTFIRYLCPHP